MPLRHREDDDDDDDDDDDVHMVFTCFSQALHMILFHMHVKYAHETCEMLRKSYENCVKLSQFSHGISRGFSHESSW